MQFDHKNKVASIPVTEHIDKKLYTEKQGQYLAFIYYYTKINGQLPAERDMQRYFGVSAPSVHSMIIELEKNGMIDREIKKARSLKIKLDIEMLPRLI